MNLFQYIRKQRSSYENHTIPVVEGYDYSQYRKFKREELYWAGIHEQKVWDAAFNGAPPFDNSKIKKSVIEEYLKTDFDTKDVEVRPKKPTQEARVKAMLTKVALRKWMDDHKMGTIFNEMCWTRAKNGGVLLKKDKDGVHVVPWLNVITDQSDLMSGIVIERHYYTPAELKKKDGEWQNVDAAILLAESRKEVALNEQQKDTQGDLIEVYEVHGLLPESYLKEDGDDHKYVESFYVLAGVEDYDTNEDGEIEENGIILFQDQEKELPYKLLNRNPIHGRAVGTSVIEDLFETTKWKNFTLAESFRVMALGSKIMYITDDPDLPDNLHDGFVENGEVLKKNSDTTFAQVSTIPTGLPNLDTVRAELVNNERDITGMYEANTGEQGKSNTPFRAQALQSMEGNARFEQYREEISLFLNEVIKDWILPMAMKDIVKEDELYAEFSGADLAMIDDAIMNTEITKQRVENIKKGKVTTTEEVRAMQMAISQGLMRSGSKRFIEKVKGFIDGIDADVRVVTSNEGLNKQGFFETRNNLLQYFPENDPRREAILDRIADEAGVTPDELTLKREQMGFQPADTEFTEEKSNAEKVLNQTV